MRNPSTLEPFREQILIWYYEDLLSTKDIAERLGLPSYGGVVWMLRGRLRDRGDAIALSKPPSSIERSACYHRSRGVMRRYLKRRLRPEEHVHHRNGDITDNRLENLQVLHVADHNRHHHRLRAEKKRAAKASGV